MKHSYYNLVVLPPGTVLLGKYERVCSNEAVARAVVGEGVERRAHAEALRRAREDPKHSPHPYVMTEFTVRPASHAELERREEEKTVLQYLRGGKG